MRGVWRRGLRLLRKLTRLPGLLYREAETGPDRHGEARGREDDDRITASARIVWRGIRGVYARSEQREDGDESNEAHVANICAP